MGEHGFLVDAFIFLSAAVVVVPLAKRGGLSAVLGYLLAGVVVGPYGLKLVSRPEDILHFSEAGVVLMLFLIGLELQPRMLWNLRRPIIGLGGAQVLVTGIAITGSAVVLGADWRASLTIGMALALSSTAIGLQLLHEKRQFKTTAGHSAFSVLLFQDIAVIPMLAVLPLLGTNTDVAEAGPLAALPGWLDAAIITMVVAGIVLAGRFLFRSLVKYIASTGIREIFTAFSLFLVIGIVLLMQTIGISPALGAFLAGVVLADSEYRRALEADIEPFKGLLLGLFFISVGMSIDFALLAREPAQIVGLLAGLIVLKLVILIILGRLFGLRSGENVLFTFLLAQGGEFAFVLFQFAVGRGALAPELAGRLVLIVALSMVVTPLLMIVNERLVQPHLGHRKAARAADVVDVEDSPVIIVGYGRFGQIIGRFLRANGIPPTVLDNDPDHLEVLRRFGHKAFYGDGSRIDVLTAAGADRTKLIVLTMDEPEANVETTKAIRQHFPNVKVLARAHDRDHAFQLMSAGAEIIRREYFEGALSLGRDALILLGMHPYEAKRKAGTFIHHDRDMMHQGYSVRDDEASMIALARRSSEELEALFRADREDVERSRDAGWGE